MTPHLNGRRILVVEDSPGVAEASAHILGDLGCTVVGPAGSMASARSRAEAEALDAAIVDVNIRGDKIYPDLRILVLRKIPFVLTSGYAGWSMPQEWQERPRLAKPYSAAMLRESLLDLLKH